MRGVMTAGGNLTNTTGRSRRVHSHLRRAVDVDVLTRLHDEMGSSP